MEYSTQDVEKSKMCWQCTVLESSAGKEAQGSNLVNKIIQLTSAQVRSYVSPPS